MPYSPTTWVDGTTPVDAAHLNPIETELVLLDGRIVPNPTGQDGKWLTVSGGAMVWSPAPGAGGGLDWEGAWSGATAYVKGDVVTYGGVVYGAVNDGTNQTPPAASPTYPTFTPLPLVTSLPSSPFDGQIVIFTDSLTAPTYTWMLQYVAAKASNKWVFIGGTAANVVIDTDETTTTTATLLDLTTVGPQFTIPVAGSYFMQARADFYHTVVPSHGSIAICLAGGAGLISEGAPQAVANTSVGLLVQRVMTWSAGNVARMRYQMPTAGTGHWVYRSLFVQPVAIGG